jgi:uncharacterized membrane protein
MKSKAAFMGHPIHPMLVTLPIGLWVAALVCDIVFATTHTVFWYDMAYWSMAFGLVGGAIAAVPGLIDYATALKNSPLARATARHHLILNVVVMVAYVVNLVLRGDYAAVGSGMFMGVVALSVVSLGVLSLSGYLGGRLVYEYGAGLDRDDLRVSMLEAEREEATKR